MTRESKLALILSFVLILVVGVLVSDHFSSAGSMIPDTLDEDQGVIAPLPGADRSGLDHAIDRVMPESDGSSARSLLEQMTESVRSMEVPALASEGEDVGLAPVEILNTSIPDRDPEPVVREPVRRDARATYTVRAGDSLYRISVNTLGDGERWREIHELNRATLGADPVLQPGMVLELPGGARSSVVVTPRVSEPAPVPAKKGRTHVVQAGDTLGEISQKYLGTVKRMNEIVKLNGLDDADDIRLGMTLKIPD